MKKMINIEFQQFENLWVPICNQYSLVGYSGSSLEEVRDRAFDALRFAFEPEEIDFVQSIKFENSSASA
ncbi:MAG: hypothetical protein WCI68_05435 [Actinomycetes bacterium]